MKNFMLVSFLMLLGCTSVSNLPGISGLSVERNEDCMEMYRFKIFQVLGDNYALANECKSSDGDYCLGAVVLLTPQKGIDYYDDMFVSLPKDKCAVQDGVYTYETKNKSYKTVPRIRWQYEYSPRSEEETMSRLHKKMDETLDECLTALKENKKHNTPANRKKCECGVEMLSNEVLSAKNGEESKYSTGEEFVKAINKKCGKLPVNFW